MSNDRMTEMMNLMAAMAREVGLFRQETNARFDQLEARLDRNEGEMKSLHDVVDATRSEVSATRSEMNARLERLEVNTRETKRDFRIFRKERAADMREVAELEERIEALEGEPA